ncbi:autotransporter outer membrane beta-barrel domain-containing protein [Dongia sp.]|uniref:autotransporter outer membrane beta-barrel domain-containing protein n=1 Tax=Dongia sp. TaxID=1977262 RepID=UPI0035B43CC3
MAFLGKSLRLALMATVFCGTAVTLARADDEIEKKIRDEVSRRVTDAISKRIGDDVTSDMEGMPDTGYTNSVWLTPSYANITSDSDSLIEEAGSKFDTDLWTVPFGFDHRFGDSFFLGLSAAYANSATDIDIIDGGPDADFYSDTFTVSPYAAYRFADYFFATALFSYAYSDGKSTADDTDDVDSDSQTFSTELALNAAAPVGDFILKGKAGWRFAYTELLDFEAEGDDDSDAHTAVGSFEVGYNLDPFVPYLGVQYEHVFPENVPEVDEGDQDFLYLSGGVRGRVNDWLSLGAGVRAEVVNQETNQIGGQVEFKARF